MAQQEKLSAAQGEAAKKVGKLQDELLLEVERLDALRKQAAEHAQFRDQIKAALAENDYIKKALQREVEASINAKRRGELEAELA